MLDTIPEKRFSAINFAMPDPPMEDDEDEDDDTKNDPPPNQEFKAFSFLIGK